MILMMELEGYTGGVINIKGRFLKIKNTDYFILSVFYQVAIVCLKKITCESVVYLHQCTMCTMPAYMCTVPAYMCIMTVGTCIL